MIRAKIDNAADWVKSRISHMPEPQASKSDIAGTLTTLNKLISEAEATFLVPDLFPLVRLETLYVHGCESTPSEPNASPLIGSQDKATAMALTAIGTAIVREMEQSGTNLLRFPLPNACEVVVFLPEARSLVLQVTGTTLLTT